ncbi:MAG: GDSL-type esterase/lipase family protein [Oenococcus sp.]|uniref:GDSL-type esterase/lipase family protein n=1 Tax=Oenococcus TaxID=46254 RepID=UPI0039EC640E
MVITVLGFFFVSKNQTDNSIRSNDKQHIFVVFLGDSLTYGVGDQAGEQGYTGRTIKLLEKTFPEYRFSFENFGKPGDRSDQILKRLNGSVQQQAAVKKADVLVMTVGGNDLRQQFLRYANAEDPNKLSRDIQKGQENYEQSLSRLLNRIHDLRTQTPLFLFGNYNPIFVNTASRSDINQDVQGYNSINKKLVESQRDGHYLSVFRQLTYGQYQSRTQIRQLAKEDRIYNGQLANPLQSALLRGKDKIKNNYISSADHFHPNNLGYDYMSKTLFNSMRDYNQWQKK